MIHRKFIAIALPGAAIATALLFWDQQPASQSAPAPENCALLSLQTVARSHSPPPTLAEFDALLETVETRAQRLPTTGPFLHEAANRRLQRFSAMRDLEDLEIAAALTEQQIRQNPSNMVARARRSAISLARHEFQAALDDARAAVHYPLEFDALFELGELAAARNVLALIPTQGLAPRLRHVRMADHDGDPGRASSLLAAATQHARDTSLHPLTLAGVLAQSATLALHNQNYGSACRLYAEALELHPQHVATLDWLGRWAWHRDQTEIAVALLQRATELEPFNAARLQWLAEAQTARGAAELGSDLSRQALSAAQRWPHWYRLLSARHFASTGEAESALSLLSTEFDYRQGLEYWHAVLDVATSLGDVQSAEQANAALLAFGAQHPGILYSYWQAAQRFGWKPENAQLLAELVRGRVELSPLQWRAVENRLN